ncbi:GPW/gp25 family protein [Halorussus sp. MSC15.2]|uniref:GPW/gp25 family protein n=1 Tax=Halorussus sp. MSC15.2 TaxID=2283638 RepID=UPI0013D5853B|nr:GPW/gp25 family protein [Halorussus sp. MSC15.2]NEU58593.1 GPW/gp25 family protein [Halorussus sp. MSC15.2]
MAQFGKTLALESNGDLEVNELNTLSWVRGPEAVVQDLKVTLATRQGEDPFDPDHGLDTFAATGTAESRLKLEIVQTLNRDDRVNKVDEVRIDRDPDSRKTSATVQVTLVDGSQHVFEVAQ